MDLFTSRITFIYVLEDPFTGAARYIGKSNNPVKRLERHLRESRASQRCLRHCWFKALQDCGVRPIMKILERCEETRWVERERYWIAYYRDRGADLTNGTDGGDGLHNPSLETRARIAAGVGKAHRGRAKGPEHRAKLLVAAKKASDAAKTPEVRAKQSASAKLRGLSPGFRAAAEKKRHLSLVDPSGHLVEFDGVRAFCAANGLYTSGLYALLNGKTSSYRGWHIPRPPEDGK